MAKKRKHGSKGAAKYKIVCGKTAVKGRHKKLAAAKKHRARAAKKHDSSCRVVKC